MNRLRVRLCAIPPSWGAGVPYRTPHPEGGSPKAIVAVARAMLTAVYFMLKRGVDYRDLGPDHFQRTERTRLAARLARKLDELGFDVTLIERAAA